MKKKVSYKAALKDPRWQRKRLAIFERAEWRCEWCGAARSHLQVHHGYYGKTAGKLREPWEVPNDVLYCLCRLCHEKAEVAKQALYLEVGRIHPKEHWELRDVLKKFQQVVGEGDEGFGKR